MEIIFVFLGVGVVWALIRMAKTQTVRAQAEVARAHIEAAKVADDHRAREIDRLLRTLGTSDDAKREHRLIEYYDQSMLALGLDEDSVREQLAQTKNKQARLDLAIESVERGVPCRFLSKYDYDEAVPEAFYPGPVYEVDIVCSAFCDESTGDALDYLTIPASAKTCPFCGAPTKPMMDQSFDDKYRAEWEANDRAWQLWKKWSPEKAKESEARDKGHRDREVARERDELATAVANFNAKNPAAAQARDALLAAAQRAIVPTQSIACPACPQCRAPTIHIAEFNRWRCDRCNVYA